MIFCAEQHKCIKVNLKKENVFEYALESAVSPLSYSIEHGFVVQLCKNNLPNVG